jgi:DNA-binding transcriptional LysR family regulator
MELRQLRYLEAVARHRSFTRAARELHIAPSALSQQVRALERELGVELLRRTTRRVAVTEAGGLVLAHARRALAELEGVRADLDALRGLVRGTLRIGGVAPLGYPRSAALIAAFIRAHPGVVITVREGAAFALLGQLRDGALDLVLALVDPGGLDGLEGVRLLDSELVAIAALNHPFARVERVPVERLAREPLLTLGADSPLHDTLLALASGGRVVAEVNQLENLRELTACGLGVSLVRRVDVAEHGDRLAIRPLNPPQTLPVSLIWRAREQLTPAAHAFRAQLLATAKKGQPI